MHYQGTSAIISGGASGLGAATARLLAQHEIKPIILDRNQALAEQLAQELEGLAFALDVTDANDVANAIANAYEQVGAARICVNCAGIAPAKRLVGRDGAHSLEEFNQVIQINLIGTFNVMRLAAEKMTQVSPLPHGERGIIINTASIAAYEGQIGQTAYSASKGGIVAMTLPAARELAQHQIRVNTIAPGVMATPMMSQMPEKVKKSLEQLVPYPSRLGQPSEYAQLVTSIIENQYLNGTVIRLDGAIRMT